MSFCITDQSTATNGTVTATTTTGAIPSVGYPATLVVSVATNAATFMTETSGEGALNIAAGATAIPVWDFEAGTAVNVRSDSGSAAIKYSWVRLAR